MAQAFLEKGEFRPSYAADLWAFGTLILLLLRTKPPAEHWSRLTSAAYQQDLDQNRNPRTALGLKAHLEYLSGLLDSQTDYASQVCC